MDFNREAAAWDNVRRQARAAKLADKIRANWGEHPASALDFGCGTGLLTFALAPYAGEIAGHDTSREMRGMFLSKIGATGAQNVRFLAEEELSGQAFDAIYTSMVLHHIKDVPAQIARLKALLTQNGRFLWLDIDEDDGTFHRDEPDFDGHNGFDRAYVQKILTESGFRKVNIETAYEGTREIGGIPANYSIFLAVAQS